jgi:O-antigen ligase
MTAASPNPPVIAETSVRTEAQNWIVAAVVLASLPFVQGLFTWTWSGVPNSMQALIRIFSLITLCGVIMVIFVGLKSGFDSAKAIGSAPRAVQILLAIWLVSALAAMLGNEGRLLIPALILLRYILMALAFAALIHIIRQSDRFDAAIWYWIIAVGGAVYAISLISFILLIPNPDTFSWLSGMPSATSIRHIGNYLAILALAPATLMLLGKKAHVWKAAAIAFVLITFIAWSGSRAALIGILAAAAAGWVLTWRHVKLPRIALLIGLFGASIGTSFVLPNPSPSYGLARVVDKMQAGEDASSGRSELWQSSITEIIDVPLLGHGAGRFARNMGDKYGYDFDNPHNFVLQYLYDWGLFGGLAAMLLVGWIGLSIWQARFRAPLMLFAGAAGFAMLITIGMLEGMLYHPLKIMLVAAMIAPVLGRNMDAEIA